MHLLMQKCNFHDLEQVNAESSACQGALSFRETFLTNQSINQSIHQSISADEDIIDGRKSERLFESLPLFIGDLPLFPQRLARLPLCPGEALPHPLGHIRYGEGDHALGADDQVLEGDKEQDLRQRTHWRQQTLMTMDVHVEKSSVGHHA